MAKPPTIIGKYNIEKVWTDETKGLSKELIFYRYQSLTKANDLSKICVAISEINGLQDHHESIYLRDESHDMEYWIELANAVTPIDCYIEIFLKRMLIGEISRCAIKTRSADEISFIIKVIRIEFGGHYYALDLLKLVELAKRYKENGVKMFKKYPLFAHDYFNRAAKCIISLQPFDTLKDREIGLVGANPEALRDLLENIQMNIAACLIKEKRYDEALHVLEFAERPDNVPEKAIYRRSNALFLAGKLDEAKKTMERLNYAENKECAALYEKIVDKWKQSNENYRKMVKNMFS